LTGGDDVFKVIDVGDQTCRLEIMRTDKILPDPVLEHLGLADIDDVPAFVLHQVAAGLRREDRQLVGDLFHICHISVFPSASVRRWWLPGRLRPDRPCGSSPPLYAS